MAATGGGFTASDIEQSALAWLESIGWPVLHGTEIAPGESAAERDNYGQVFLEQRLRDALAQLNPNLPAEALDDAFRKLTRPEGAELVACNPLADPDLPQLQVVIEGLFAPRRFLDLVRDFIVFEDDGGSRLAPMRLGVDGMADVFFRLSIIGGPQHIVRGGSRVLSTTSRRPTEG